MRVSFYMSKIFLFSFFWIMCNMSVYSSMFLCTFFAYQGMGLLFLCSFNRDLINIELKCSGGAKIDIVKVKGFRSNHKYSCTNNNKETQPNKTHGLRRAMWHRIFTNCANENRCNYLFYPDSYPENDSHGIAIEYNCLPDDKFIRFCNKESTSMIHPNGNVNLIFKNAGSVMHNMCTCDVEGHFSASLTQFPTHSGYLQMEPGREETYKSKVYFDDHSVIHHDKDKTRHTFVVKYDLKKLNEDVPFILVKFLVAEDKYGSLSVNCTQEKTTVHSTNPLTTASDFLDPVQTNPDAKPIVWYAVTATVTAAVTVLCVGACAAIVYVYYANKEKETKSKKIGSVLASTRRFTRNMQTSFSVNCAESLSHSYAEIGSVSDYRHYVMPDDVSQRSFRMKICLEKLGEAPPSGFSANPNSNPHEEAETRAKRQTSKEMNNVNKNDTENNATIKNVACVSKSKMTNENIEKVHLRNKKTDKDECLVLAKTTDKGNIDENPNLPKNSEAEHKSERENKTISREHYDPSGYLDLNITEKTSHQYLQKWINEIYSVEQKAKQARKEGNDEVAQRRVLVVRNDQAAKQPDNFYSYAQDHKIVFSDEETLFR